ncbi:MAG: hypothetical protein ACLTCP_09025 [Ruminococcus bicirculans (ex Wegman et al. 2014)]
MAHRSRLSEFPADKSLYNMLSNVERYLAVKAKPAICQKFFCFRESGADSTGLDELIDGGFPLGGALRYT